MITNYYTAIPYRASTGPEQGFPCVVCIFTQEKPVFIAGFPVGENRVSLLEILHRENPVFVTGIGLQCILPNIRYQFQHWDLFKFTIEFGNFGNFGKVSVKSPCVC